MKRTLKMESDTDSTTSSSSGSRLGKCEVCDMKEARYTCPKCEVKSCSLPCLNIHKKELICDGIRDKTKYIPLKKMTKMDFLNDYCFLEDCTRYIEDRKRDKMKRFTRFNKNLPSELFQLRDAAHSRLIELRILLDNFTKRSINTTFYDKNLKVIFWRVEWIFPNAGNLKYVDEKCSEKENLNALLDKYLNSQNFESFQYRKNLELYQARGFGKLKVLLKAEGVKNCKNRFFELKFDKSLKHNLSGKTIVEFPSIYICYDDDTDAFDIIDSDEDVVAEAREYMKSLEQQCRSTVKMEIAETSKKTDEELEEEMNRLIIKKKREERKQRREESDKEPKNYLFSNLWNDEDLSSSGVETEEENDSNVKV